jgi:hypothetical protein
VDYRKHPGTPSKQSDRDKAAALRDWIDAALAHYERQGGLWGIFVRKSPPPGVPPASLDMQLETEGAPLREMGLAAEEPPRIRIAE